MLLEGDDQRRRATQFRVLTARFACRAASQLLVRNTWDSLWLLAFSDVAEQAVVRGNVNAATELLTFLVTPIISSFTDAYGRRAGQVFCAVCNLFYQLCGSTLGLQGSVNGLIAGQFFFALAQQGQTLQRASMGDLYMADPVQYTSALSKMELCCEPHLRQHTLLASSLTAVHSRKIPLTLRRDLRRAVLAKLALTVLVLLACRPLLQDEHATGRGHDN